MHGFFARFRRQATIICYMCVFLSFYVVDAMRCFTERPPLVATCVSFSFFSFFMFFVFFMLCAWVLDWLRKQATIRCYICVFFGFLVFLMLCAWVF